MNLPRTDIAQAVAHAHQLRGEVQIVMLGPSVFLRTSPHVQPVTEGETELYRGEGKHAVAPK